MQVLTIAGYRFILLSQLDELRSLFLEKCTALKLKGTILLSEEGININLSGEPKEMILFKDFLKQDALFFDMVFRENYSDRPSFQRLKVKIKKEIITFKKPGIRPSEKRAPTISSQELKKWLDEKQDITLLDTRNHYEVDMGTFENAVNLHLKDFSAFPKAAEKLERKKTVVMFCTGGIRCEKAALHLLDVGFEKVYQLDGGILNYFSEVGMAHYQGKCFVFDERTAVLA